MPPGFLDRLADAIVSVEYYMETLQAGRSDPWYMLDNAQPACRRSSSQTAVPTVPPLDPGLRAHRADRGAGAAAPRCRTWRAIEAAAPTLQQSAHEVAPPMHADPELVELFIEEAARKLAKITAVLPGCGTRTRSSATRWSTVRRSFHTLKGSGRMVGARDLGEFAWVDREPAEPGASTTRSTPLAGHPRGACAPRWPRCRKLMRSWTAARP